MNVISSLRGLALALTLISLAFAPALASSDTPLTSDTHESQLFTSGETVMLLASNDGNRYRHYRYKRRDKDRDDDKKVALTLRGTRTWWLPGYQRCETA